MFQLVLILLLLSPMGPVAVKQEISMESEEKCEMFRAYLMKNTQIQSNLPLEGASVQCVRKNET